MFSMIVFLFYVEVPSNLIWKLVAASSGYNRSKLLLGLGTSPFRLFYLNFDNRQINVHPCFFQCPTRRLEGHSYLEKVGCTVHPVQRDLEGVTARVMDDDTSLVTARSLVKPEKAGQNLF